MEGLRRWVTQRTTSVINFPEKEETTQQEASKEATAATVPEVVSPSNNDNADQTDMQNRESSLGVMMEYEA